MLASDAGVRIGVLWKPSDLDAGGLHSDQSENNQEPHRRPFRFIRLTIAFQPRRLMMAPADDGCKRRLGGHAERRFKHYGNPLV